MREAASSPTLQTVEPIIFYKRAYAYFLTDYDDNRKCGS